VVVQPQVLQALDAVGEAYRACGRYRKACRALVDTLLFTFLVGIELIY